MTQEKQPFCPPGYDLEEWRQLRHRMPTLERIGALLSGDYPSPEVLRSRTNEEITTLRESLAQRTSQRNLDQLNAVLEGEPIDEEFELSPMGEKPAISLAEMMEEVMGQYAFEGLEHIIIKLRYLSNLTDEAIAQELHLSLEEVASIKARAVEKMRRYHTPGV